MILLDAFYTEAEARKFAVPLPDKPDIDLSEMVTAPDAKDVRFFSGKRIINHLKKLHEVDASQPSGE